MNLKQTLEWCAEYGVAIQITQEAGMLVVSARHLNISAGFPVEEPIGINTIGQALFDTLYSVEFGSKFHQQHGFMPEFEKTERGSGAGGSQTKPADVPEGFMPPQTPGNHFGT